MTALARFEGLTVKFWDCCDAEVLEHEDPISALEECVEKHLDGRPIEDVIREMGAIPVEGYNVKAFAQSDIVDAIDRALDVVVEALEEDHGHPEGDQPMFKLDVLAKHRPAFEAAVRALAADAKIWQCELASTVELTPDETIEILRWQRPDWFEPAGESVSEAAPAMPPEAP